MSEQIKTILKRKLDELAPFRNLDVEMRRNALKEELQFYVLNFIYHHPEYNAWIMYGGSALRIIHDINRMSVDLDFEISHEITPTFLNKLVEETEKHFSNTYGITSDFLTIKKNGERGVTLKFRTGKLISGLTSELVDVKIDLNRFVAPRTVTERRPINRGQLSFVILTYNMGALMASKIAAIFLREQRGVDKNTYDYKGRDIYDLLWYMSKKTVPDFDYLNAKLKEKGVEVSDIKTLFDTLTVKILNYEKMDDLLKKDLAHLFENPFQFDGWFKTWRDSYLRLLDDYKIRVITKLERVLIHHNVRIGTGDNYVFQYWLNTEDNKLVNITYILYEDWIIYGEGNLSVDINKELENKIEFSSNSQYLRTGPEENKLKQYATLFYEKTEKYLKKTNRVLLGDGIITKVIRWTANNLNQKEQILRTKSALLSCELDDLLK